MSKCVICGKDHQSGLALDQGCLAELLLAVRALAPDLCVLCKNRYSCPVNVGSAYKCSFLLNGEAAARLIREANRKAARE